MQIKLNTSTLIVQWTDDTCKQLQLSNDILVCVLFCLSVDGKFETTDGKKWLLCEKKKLLGFYLNN